MGLGHGQGEISRGHPSRTPPTFKKSAHRAPRRKYPRVAAWLRTGSWELLLGPGTGVVLSGTKHQRGQGRAAL